MCSITGGLFRRDVAPRRTEKIGVFTSTRSSSFYLRQQYPFVTASYRGTTTKKLSIVEAAVAHLQRKHFWGVAVTMWCLGYNPLEEFRENHATSLTMGHFWVAPSTTTVTPELLQPRCSRVVETCMFTRAFFGFAVPSGHPAERSCISPPSSLVPFSMHTRPSCLKKNNRRRLLSVHQLDPTERQQRTFVMFVTKTAKGYTMCEPPELCPNVGGTERL